MRGQIEDDSTAHESDIDLGSYEGKYPRDLFNKSVVIEKDRETRPVGRVQMEGEDTIVVFGDSGERYDIPKSQISVSGGNIVLAGQDLGSYIVDKDSPLPAAKSLRPSAEEIRSIGREQTQANETRADPVLREYDYLTKQPRPETTTVERPATYVDQESETSKKLKAAVAELRELLFAGTRVAKQKAKETKRKADKKKAESDARVISRMGELAPRFSEAFENIIFEIRTRPYAEQEQIYNGFLRLIDYQRDLVSARRDLAARLKDTVATSPVSPNDVKRGTRRRQLGLKRQPALPDKLVDDDAESDRMDARRKAYRNR